MPAAQSDVRTRLAGKPVHRGPIDAELGARFEREVVPLCETLYRHAFRLSRDHADAEDLVQETMTKAYTGFHSLRPGSNVNAWLFRILTNIYISGYRKTRRQPVHCSTEEVTDRHMAAACAHYTPMRWRSAEDHVLEALPNNDIKAAMQVLPRRFREVVYYADVEGYAYREIAAIMNIPHGTVMSQLHRGRRRLRTLLGDCVDRGGPETLPATG
jgi:RNA polymerase sigma-70 factor, ECF subfamily